MALPKTSHVRGFTLVEILVVIGILATLSALTVIASITDYKGSSFRNERDIIVSMIQKARAQSINNMCFTSGCSDGAPHGFHYEAGKYVIFEGTAYTPGDPVNEVKESAYTVTISGINDVVFDQLSGAVHIPGTITITDDSGKTSIIDINSEGRVAWSN